MRIAQTLICLVILTALALAPNPSQRGIEVSDIDRHADPCTDFYDFANGSWRAANPIPPSMPRGSRRWAAGEGSKDRLADPGVRSKADPGVRSILCTKRWTAVSEPLQSGGQAARMARHQWHG
jgi:hypothetical protein